MWTINTFIDSIVLAVDSSKDVDLDDFGKSWLNGILAILDTINKSLEGIGLKQYIPNKGEFFDSGIHEAVATAKEGEKGKIYDIVQPGYILNDSVIRPARVVVSK